MMKNLLFFVLVAASLSAAKPANDWAAPCFHGECAYDLAGSEKTGHGVLVIRGPPKTISDITPAAGWVVLNCDRNALAQDIRLVCKSHDAEAEGCGHLFANGPVNKIIRLPESCGANPFARVNNARVAEDQGIPAHKEAHIMRRDGAVPQVHILSVDTNWAAVDVSEAGTVTFGFAGANMPGFEGNALDADWNPISAIKDAVVKVKDGAVKVVDTVKDGVVKAVDTVKDGVNKVNNWGFDKKTDPKVLDISKSLTLLDVKQQCGPITAALQVDVSANVHVEAVFCVAGSGTLVPPKIDKFQACALLDASAEARLKAVARLNGVLDSGRKVFVQQGIPGFSIPGIVTVGPFIELAGRATAQIDVDLTVDVGINWQAKGVSFWIPASGAPAAPKGISPLDTPVNIQAGAELTATGTVEGHIYALFKFGIDMFAGKATLNAYVGADAFGKVELTAKGSATGSASLRASEVEGSAERMYVPPYDMSARELVDRELEARALAFSGCVAFSAGIAFVGGAEGNLMGFVKANKEVNIFNKVWQIYQKCFELGKAKRSLAIDMPELLVARSENLAICPKRASTMVPVASEVVKANTIR